MRSTEETHVLPILAVHLKLPDSANTVGVGSTAELDRFGDEPGSWVVSASGAKLYDFRDALRLLRHHTVQSK